MSVNRKAIVIASAALMAVTLPSAVRADDNGTQPLQQQQKQESQDQQNAKVAGTVQSYRDVNVDGSEHFRVRVKESDGQTKSVDLGDCNRCSDLIDHLEQGDQITASGQTQKVDGKQVFIADRASVDGKSYTLAQAAKESGEGGNLQSERDESRGSQANAGNQPDNKNQQSQKPAAVLLLDERMVFVGEGDLNRHLILAKEDLTLGDPRTAAGELRVAADRIDLYANASHGHNQAADLLNRSREDLQNLAKQISQNSSAVKPREIDDAAAQAQAALAKYYDEQIQSREAKDRPIETGYDLQAAAVHAREAMVWSDENVSDHAARSIDTALKTADDLLSGNQKAGNNAEQVAQNLNRQIDQLDKMLDQSQTKPVSDQMSPDQKNKNDNQQQPEDGNPQPDRANS
jgi:hypothetical protein